MPLLNQPASHSPFRPKLWTALATAFVGIFFEKNFGEVLDLYQLAIRRNFEYLEKNGVFKFFERVRSPGETLVVLDLAEHEKSFLGSFENSRSKGSK